MLVAVVFFELFQAFSTVLHCHCHCQLFLVLFEYQYRCSRQRLS